MGQAERKKLYKQIEKHRGCPLIAYVTSGRQGAQGMISSDAMRKFAEQLFSLPKDTKKIDLLINSLGGDGLASWRLITMIREFLGHEGYITCLVPYYAFSAGTLIAVGSNEIFMHPMASLGPVDPQIIVQTQGGATQFAYEDLAAYTNFLKEEGGLTEQTEKSGLLQSLVGEIKPSVIGASKRSSMQSIIMAQKLMKLHMTGADSQKAEIIAEKLSKSFFSHGHALSHKEASDLGLKISKTDSVLENLIWEVFVDFEKEMKMDEIFDPVMLYLNDPRSISMLQPPPIVNIPANTPPQMVQQIWQQVLSQISTASGPVLDFKLVFASVESSRLSVTYIREGKIFGSRQPDLNFLIGMPRLAEKWE
jgi:ATP-dependent protease ClpP protease subunit